MMNTNLYLQLKISFFLNSGRSSTTKSNKRKRRPNSEYASYSNCIFETQSATKLMKKEKITFFDMTNQSIEEISSNFTIY